MTQMLGLSDKDFQEAFIKILQSQSLKKRNGIEKSQQRNRSYKRKQSRNYISKKCNRYEVMSLDMLKSNVELIEDD